MPKINSDLDSLTSTASAGTHSSAFKQNSHKTRNHFHKTTKR